ncbi:ClpP/crotonase-like domain-containing protein [Chytriomyces sp. MP71]|nr:ClpP/crotonase-like domain-containing protein [Chytriomyces sp. MP71]
MSVVTTSNIGSILKVSLSSAPVNALSRPVISGLREAVAGANRKGSGVTGILLSSSLPKVFSAGLDLSELIVHNQAKNTRDSVNSYIGSFQMLVRELSGSHVPTAAVVHGATPAGGTVLAFCTDYKVASSAQVGQFRMGLNETRVGLAPPLWLHELARLNLHSARLADRLVQLGHLCASPDEALRHGFLDAVLPNATPDSLEARAVEELSLLAGIPWHARVSAKMGARMELLRLLDSNGTEEMVECIVGEEFQEVTGALLASLKKKK